MGNSIYSFSDRSVRTKSFAKLSRDDTFTQNRERRMHKDMNPNGVLIRESCDSKEPPETVPVQLYLDVTGSMGHIPHEMIKEGLPKLVGALIQNGIPDVALMFGAIGDHEEDRCPLQIGQFESGDKELDMWLTRSYLEGGGGGNMGESYLLAWYFAGNHTKIDSFDKRGKKGFVFTVGDEPCLPDLLVSAVKEIMGEAAIGQGNFTKEELLAKAQEKNHVFHIHVNHGRSCDCAWKQMLGENLIEITDYKNISDVISEIILSRSDGISKIHHEVKEVLDKGSDKGSDEGSDEEPML